MKKNLGLNDETVQYEILSQEKNFVEVSLNNKSFKVKVIKQNSEGVTFELNDKNVFIPCSGHYFSFQGQNFKIASLNERGRKGPKKGTSSMSSPMPGKILKVFIAPGAQVKKGDALLVMEAMKMEHTIKASGDGIIKEILYSEGDQVEGGVDLFDFEQG